MDNDYDKEDLKRPGTLSEAMPADVSSMLKWPARELTGAKVTHGVF